MARELQVADVFAGCGGLTAGFVEAGFAPVAAVEHDMAAAATYAENFGDHVQVSDAWDFAAGSFPRVDVVIGGPPCQGFSNLGQRRSNDPRNDLWRALVEVVRKTRPAYFLLENVPDFLKSPQYRALVQTTQRGGALDRYEICVAEVVNAADYGAAQVRRRAVVVGAAHVPLSMPAPTHSRTGARGLSPWRTVDAVLGGLPEPGSGLWPKGEEVFHGVPLPGVFTTEALHLAPLLSELSAARYAAVPVGGDRRDLPPALQAPCWQRATTGSADVMGRLHGDRPSVTLRTEFYKPEKGRYLHPRAPRALTIAEGALLQGFPRRFRWWGGRSDVARQIGNAVPVPLAAALARHLRRFLA